MGSAISHISLGGIVHKASMGKFGFLATERSVGQKQVAFTMSQVVGKMEQMAEHAEHKMSNVRMFTKPVRFAFFLTYVYIFRYFWPSIAFFFHFATIHSIVPSKKMEVSLQYRIHSGSYVGYGYITRTAGRYAMISVGG